MGSRPLTEGEIELAEEIFGNTQTGIDTIDYSKVLIFDEKYKPPLWPLPSFQPDDTVMAPDGNIYYPPSLHLNDFSAGSDNQKALFIHEMVHVLQDQLGVNVSVNRINEGGDYNYDPIFHGTPFHELPIEAQAEFLEDLYRKRNGIDIDPNKQGGALENPTRPLSEYEDEVPFGFPQGIGPESVDDLVPDPNELQIPIPPIVPDWVPQAKVPFDTAPQQDSPLVLDLDGDGIELVALDTANPGAFFDLDNDGFAEATGWVAPDDGLLARDVNGNGRIDNAGELFGSIDVDGFSLLAELDTNGDLVINQFDADFAGLLIWQDANGDGFSQDGELLALSSYNIASIDLAGVSPSADMIAENTISHVSSFAYTDGTVGSIVDAWLAVDNTLSTYMYDHTFELEAMTLYLPTLRGYGELPDLHIAMSLDNGGGGLLEQMAAFVMDFSFSSFADGAALRADIESILFKWAGTTPEGQIFPDGPYAGAVAYEEEFQFVEKQFGVLSESSIDGGAGGRVPGGSARALMESFEISYQNLKAHLLLQVGAAQLFENAVTYNAFTGGIDGDLALSQTAIADLETHATAEGVDAQVFWVGVAEFLDTVKGYSNFTAAEDGWLNTAIANSDPALDWQIIKDLTAFEYQPSTIFGTNGDDIIDGTAGDNIIEGYLGNDVIDGKAGNDTIYGNTSGPTTPEDDATYIGGEGDDIINGGQGDDLYIYTSGDDYYEDISGSDVIRLPAGVTVQDLSFGVQEGVNLMVTVADLGTIEVKNQFDTYPYTIETIEFADSTTLDLSTINNLVQYGTSADDVLYGITTGAGPDDSLYGLDGNDTIYDGYGNDIIDGGAGNDKIILWGGDDTIIASAGFDTVDASDGFETLLIPDSYSASDVSLLQVAADGDQNYNDLQIMINGLGQILVKNHFAGTTLALDQISFENGDASINLLTHTFHINGTSGDDAFQFSSLSQDNTIYRFGTGNDSVTENAGTDTLLFGAGYDLTNITVQKHDVGSSWDTTDNLVIADANGNSFTFKGHFDASYKRLEKLEFNDGTIVSLSSLAIESHGSEGADSIDGIEAGEGLPDDVIYGYGGNDNIYSGTGNDTVYGGDGNDYIYAGEGNDSLYGGAGDDHLYGELGDDTFMQPQGSDSVYDTGGLDTIVLGSHIIEDVTFTANIDDLLLSMNGGADQVDIDRQLGSNPDYVIETINFADGMSLDLARFNDWLFAAPGGQYVAGDDLLDDIILGNSGNDTLKGRAGNDVLHGRSGDDYLEGNNGDDILYGGLGADTMKGSAGVDTFVYLSADEGGDIVTDFRPSSGEKIDMTAVLQSAPGFTDATAFSGGYLRAAQNGIDVDVYLDMDGSAGSVQQEVLFITLLDRSVSEINANAFILPAEGTSGSSNTAPVANDDSAQTDQDVAAIVNVLTNDNDIDGDNLTVSIVTSAAFGALLVNGDQTITYTPNAGYTGSDSFTYQVDDGNGGTDTATASLTVNAAVTNTTPVAVDDSFSGDQDTNIMGSVLANDSDPDGDPLSVTAETIATTHGSVDILADGNFTYTPSAGYVGADSFSYTLLDGNGGSDTATVNLTLNAVTADILGTAGNDNLTGTTGDDVIRGLGGNDFISGEEGNDTLYGDDGDDTLKGRDGDDIFYGGDGADYLEGGNDNDILYGGLGADTLKGSSGIDTFVYTSMAEAGDTIQDYRPFSGEVIDIADLLSAYDPLIDAITDFVQITDNGTDSTLAVDSDGGADNFVTVATLLGITGITDEESLETSGALVTA